MSVYLSIAVMHTPSSKERAANVETMRKSIPHLITVEDTGLGVWDTARRSWLSYSPKATHHMVIQDDASICEGFEARALIEIMLRPFVPVAFCNAGPTVALALPVPMIAAWLDWCETKTLPPHDDVKLNKWLRTQGLTITFTNPPLVKHGDFPSLLGH